MLLATTHPDAAPRMLLSAAHDRGVVEIMVPRNVMVVDRLPLLGTGKADYPAVQKLAETRGPRSDLEVEADAVV